MVGEGAAETVAGVTLYTMGTFQEGEHGSNEKGGAALQQQQLQCFLHTFSQTNIKMVFAESLH